MVIVIDIGLWKLDVDITGTRDYYKQLIINCTVQQSRRNYKAYCRSMSQEEKNFFHMLGIIPENCDVNYLGNKG